jgi:hypothetical protein
VISCSIAIAAAACVAAVGVVRGTYAAGGSDSSCYALMADAFAAGTLQPTSDLVVQVPWPDAPTTFTPGGFVPSEAKLSASAPVCAPGFSVLLAPLIVFGGLDAIFIFTPIAGALLVWLTFVSGRIIAGPLAGAMAAILVASSPVLLYQVVQPMNDVTTAALWMATFVALIRRRWMLAGSCCGLALLVRPNLLPLGAVAGLFVMLDRGVTAVGERIPNPEAPIARVAAFGLAALPFGLLVLWLNAALYGSPFRTGYGQLGHLFGPAAVQVNAPNYLKWLVETHTAFPLLAFAAPFVVAREKRAAVALAIGLVLATCIVYFFYTPFDDWSYLRFLLPAIALMVVLASAVTVHAVTYLFSRLVRLKADTADKDSASRSSVVSGFSRTVIARTAIVAAIAAAIAIFCVRTAGDRLAFDMKFLEQRYRSAGFVVRDRLPENAVVLSMWDSGAVRFHGRKEALTWAGLDPAWLDRSLAWLDTNGRTPYILVESWEEPAFRSRFANHSDIGKLDWPPKYEIDRVVRIFDPKDRARYHSGAHVNTEYLWPLRK